MVIFGSKRINETVKISLLGEEITETTEEKLLGIYVQNDLKWSKQVDKVTSEVSYSVSVLKRLADQLGKKELLMIADGLVMSKL